MLFMAYDILYTLFPKYLKLKSISINKRYFMKTATSITTFLNSILAEIILTQPKGACSDLYKILCTLLNDHGYAKECI